MIRAATMEDAAGIARVHVDSWRTTYSSVVPDDFLAGLSQEEFEERWKNWLSGESAVVYVAELSDEIVGFASGGPNRGEGYSEYEGELYAIYLLREHQHKGIGQSLFEAMTERLLEEGMDSMLVWVLEQNPACGFYEAVGGRLLGGQKIEIGGVMLREVAYCRETLKS